MAAKRKYKRRKSNDNLDIKVVGTIIVSILLAILIYANSGSLGAKLNEFLGHVMKKRMNI